MAELKRDNEMLSRHLAMKDKATQQVGGETNEDLAAMLTTLRQDLKKTAERLLASEVERDRLRSSIALLKEVTI